MATLNELIQQYCPNGVEYKELGKICKISTGKLNASSACENGQYPFFTCSKETFKTNSYSFDCEALLLAGNCDVGNVKYYNGKFDAYQRVYVLHSFENNINVKFLKFALGTNFKNYLNSKMNTGAMSYIVLSVLVEYKIPLPPIEVQNKIVEILNGFQQVADGLKAEKEFRQKQFEEYREKCLNFEPKEIAEMVKKQCPNGVEEKSIGECILSLHTGLNPRNFFKLNTPDAKNYYVTIKEMIDGKIIFNNKTNKINDAALTLCNNRSNLEVNDILFSGTGSIGNTCLLKETPTNWNIKEGIYSLKPNQEVINPKFLNFALNSSNINEIINNKINGSAVKSIKMNDLKAIQISLPSLSVQNKIVEYLEAFENLIEGLEKEYQLRLQQLNYYTEKLLQFKELKNTAK